MSATLLVTPAELDRDEIAVLGENYQHLFRAARARAGEPVRVVDGAGRARNGLVVRVEKRRGWVELGGDAPPLEPRLRVELVVAAPRPSRASWLVEKGVELGVARFLFVACERSERRVHATDAERLRRVARAAVEQCGRARLPEIATCPTLADALAGRGGAPCFVLDRSADGGPAELDPAGASGAAVLIGPEGGLTPVELALAQGAGARAVRLLPSVLRVETAALAAAAWLLIGGEA